MKPTKVAIRETIQRGSKRTGAVNPIPKTPVSLKTAPWDQQKEATK